MDASTSLRDRATAGVAWSTLHTWGTHALQLGVVLVLARILEPRDFGLFAMAQVVLMLTQALAEQGIPDALVQADRADPGLWSTGLLAVLAGSAAATLLLLVTAGPIAMLFRAPALEPVIRWLAPIMPLYGFHAVSYARARSQLAFAGHAAAGLAGAIGVFAVGVPAALAGMGVWAIVLGAYAGLLVEAAILVRVTGWIAPTAFHPVTYRRLLRYGRFIIAGAVATFLNRRTDDYFVGLYLGAEVLGYYTVAYRLLELVTTVSLRAVERVAFPVFSKLRDTPQLVADAMRTSLRFTSMTALPAFAGLAVVAGDLVLVALGPRWLSAVEPLRILALGGGALCATNILPAALRAMGHPHLPVAISAVKGVLLAAGFAVAAGYGVEAVAAVFTAGAYLVFPFFHAAVRPLVHLPVRMYLAEAMPALAAAIVMIVAMLAVRSLVPALDPLPRLALLVLAGTAAYAWAIFTVAPEQVREFHGRLRSMRRST